jgi:hypothetical protein
VESRTSEDSPLANRASENKTVVDRSHGTKMVPVIGEVDSFWGTLLRLRYCPRCSKRTMESKNRIKSNWLAKQKYTSRGDVDSLGKDWLPVLGFWHFNYNIPWWDLFGLSLFEVFWASCIWMSVSLSWVGDFSPRKMIIRSWGIKENVHQRAQTFSYNID